MIGEVQYLSDTLLIEKLAVMEIGLSKTAGVLDELSGMASSIVSEVEANTKEKGLATTLESYLATGVIIKLLGPWGWLISAVASALGFDIGDFVSSIVGSIKSKISSTGTISLSDVNSLGSSLAQSHANSFAADDGLTTKANIDLLLFLKKAEAEQNIMKIASGYAGTAWNNTPFFGGSGGILNRIFGNLFFKGGGGKSKIIMIIAGLLVWVIKTVLLGTGVVGASSAINHYINKDKNTEVPDITSTDGINTSDNTQQASYNIPPPIPNSFTNSGDGNQYHINDGSSLWIVPLLNKDVAKTLIWWTTSIYPELKGHESEFSSTNSFNNMVSLLNTGIDQNHPEYVKIPQGLHSRKEIVDRFAGEVHLKDAK